MKVLFKTKRNSEEIEINQGESILYAGLRAGLELPYECASGTCGTCQAMYLGENSIIDNWANAPGKKFIPDGVNRILMCQSLCSKDSDIRLFGPLKRQNGYYPKPDYFDAQLQKLNNENQDVISFKLKLDNVFSFNAGQFVMLKAPGVDGWRAYSICNTKLADKEIELVLKKIPFGNFSEWLFENAKINDSLKVFGPLGNACLKPEIGDTDIIAIAGGSGIAGIISIIEKAIYIGHLKRHKCKVFFGVKNGKNDFFLGRLNNLVAQTKRTLQVVIAYSEGQPSEKNIKLFPNLLFKSGLIHEVATSSIKNETLRDNSVFFIAGPPIVVSTAEEILKTDFSIKPESIRLDRFG